LEARSRTAGILLSGSTSFRTLMFGSSVSMFGSRISTVAFPMLVLHLNNSPLITGLVAFAAIAPSMLFYIPAGVLVDRWNPRRVMLGSEFLRGIAIASVVVSLKMSVAKTSVLLLIAAMVAEEILEIFSTLADRRYLSRLMERDNIASSQAYIEVRVHAAVLAGRPIGPWLFSIKPLLPFLADGLSFFFSVGSLLLLRGRNEVARKPERMSVRQLRGEVGQGFKWLWGNRRARMTVTFMAVTSLIAQALIMMFLAEAHTKELSTVGIGIVLAASGAGGALGSVTVRVMPAEVKRRWSVIKDHWLEFQLSAWSIAIGLLAVTGGTSVWCGAAAMLMLGFTGAIGNIAFGTYLVTNVADNMLAKVTSIGQVLAIGACALGPVIGGLAIQFYGPKDAVWVLFGAMAVATIVIVELDHGIVRKILDTGRWSLVWAVMTTLTLLSDDDVILAPARFICSLAKSVKRETGQHARIIWLDLTSFHGHKIVDRSRRCNVGR
jgi:MFS family permease